MRSKGTLRLFDEHNASKFPCSFAANKPNWFENRYIFSQISSNTSAMESSTIITALLSKIKDLARAFEQDSKANEHEETITLICFDPHNELSGVTADSKTQLHHIHHRVACHTELQSCITCITSNEKNNVFLLATDSSVGKIMPHVTALNQVLGVFILKLRLNHLDYTNHQCPKFMSIEDNVQSLCLSIRKAIDIADQSLPTWCFFDQDT